MAGSWNPLLDNSQVMLLCVGIPIPKNSDSYRFVEVITMFRDACSKAQILHLYNAACDIMASDLQGRNPLEVIKHKTVTMKFVMTAHNA